LQAKALKRFLERSKPRRCGLICHRNADPDAIFAAYVLARLLRKLRPSLRCDIVALEGPDRISKLLMKTIPVNWTERLPLERMDFVALVDTSSLDQLGDLGEAVEKSGKPLVVVDHHCPQAKTVQSSKVRVIDEEAKAACEVVYEMCNQLGFQIGRREALALFLGIAHETKHFHIANAKTLRIVADLAAKRINVAEALASMAQPMSHSERVARLKAASRLELHKIHGWILALSHVNSHEASAARGLVALGADIAFVVGKKGGEIRLSFRSTEDFYKKTGVHLGRDVASPLGERVSGVGGGHATAAGFNGKGEVSSVASEALKILRLKISLAQPQG